MLSNSASKNINKTPLFVGIDGGGSKCKAVIMDQNNNILGTGLSGPGNPLHGLKQATTSITASVQLALNNANLCHVKLNELIVGAGLAGVNLDTLFEQISTWQHPFKQMFLTTDLLIACLGAHQGEDGAVVITGTGSCGFSSVKGKSLIIGAHGFPHGDKGSGAWFGLQATKQVLLSLDGIVAPTLMSKQLLAIVNSKSAFELVEAIANKPATFYAKLANLVFDAAELGDAIAKNIILEGAEYINHVVAKLWQQNPPRMSIIGGLSSRLTPWLAPDISAKLSAALTPPEVGAILFAKQQLELEKTKLRYNKPVTAVGID